MLEKHLICAHNFSESFVLGVRVRSTGVIEVEKPLSNKLK
jgi:hypothetical protein